MYEFKVNGKTYKVKYGYGVLYQSDIIDRVVSANVIDQNNIAGTLKNMIGLTGELLLAGLQKCHSDEFGYDFESESERKSMIAKACDLIDDYEEEHRLEDGTFEKDCSTLLNDLQKELEKNGFLSMIMKSGEAAAAEQNATVLPQDHKRKRTRTGANK